MMLCLPYITKHEQGSFLGTKEELAGEVVRLLCDITFVIS